MNQQTTLPQPPTSPGVPVQSSPPSAGFPQYVPPIPQAAPQPGNAVPSMPPNPNAPVDPGANGAALPGTEGGLGGHPAPAPMASQQAVEMYVSEALQRATSALRAENDRLKGEIQTLRSQMQTAQPQQPSNGPAKDPQMETLEHEVRTLRQQMERQTYEAQLAAYREGRVAQMHQSNSIDPALMVFVKGATQEEIEQSIRLAMDATMKIRMRPPVLTPGAPFVPQMQQPVAPQPQQPQMQYPFQHPVAPVIPQVAGQQPMVPTTGLPTQAGGGSQAEQDAALASEAQRLTGFDAARNGQYAGARAGLFGRLGVQPPNPGALRR